MKCLALIVARGGSKGLPGKNLANLGGKPLLQWTLSFAKELKAAKLIDDAFLSTDCADMAQLADSISQIQCPELRPPHLSDDHAKTTDVAKYALQYLKSHQQKTYDYILLLQATSPFRNIQTISKLISSATTDSPDSVITCRKLEGVYEPYLYRKQGDGNLTTVSTRSMRTQYRRQDAADVFLRSGNAYLTKVSYLLTEGQFVAQNTKFVEVSDREAVNIDSQIDLELANSLI